MSPRSNEPMSASEETGRASPWFALRTAVIRALVWKGGAGALGAVVVASLAFRLYVSSECSLWLDEVLTRFGALSPWETVLRSPSPAHPPLMYSLVKLGMEVFGSGDTGVRAVSLLFGCLLLIAVHELCLELGLSVRRALLVVVVFALSPFFVRHATEARHYAIVATFFTVATTRTVRILRGPLRTRDLLVFALCASAAGATHYFGFAYALAQLAVVLVGVVLWWTRTPRVTRLGAVPALLAGLVPLAYMGLRTLEASEYFGVGQAEAGEETLTFNSELGAELLRDFSFLTDDAWAMWLQPILAGAGLILLTRRLPGLLRVLPFGLGLSPCVIALFLPAQHFLASRYLAPSFVLYLLGTCFALFAAADLLGALLLRSPSVAGFAPYVSVLLGVGLVGARLLEHPVGFEAAGDHYRGVQHYFSPERMRDTALVTYPGSFGRLMLGSQYAVGRRPISLERFKRVKGITRYLVVQIHCDQPERRAQLEAMVKRKLGITIDRWRSLPLAPLAGSTYQPPVTARLVELPPD